VTIGENAVVAACSVVRHDVPDHTLVAEFRPESSRKPTIGTHPSDSPRPDQLQSRHALHS
jgi:serine acetyltransferase